MQSKSKGEVDVQGLNGKTTLRMTQKPHASRFLSSGMDGFIFGTNQRRRRLDQTCGRLGSGDCVRK